MINKRYYVYEWFNIKNNYVFYVGKGQGRRCKRVTIRTNTFKKYYNNNECDYRVLKYFEDEYEALKYEEDLIEYYKSKNMCCCNILHGGTGKPSNNREWNNEDRENISKYNPMKVKEIAEKVNGQKRRPVRIREHEFSCVREASEYFNISTSTIRTWCCLGKNSKGIICEFITEAPQNMKASNKISITIDGILFNSVTEGALYIRCYPHSLSQALKQNRKCKGHDCKYANQQPSQVNVEKNSNLEGSETNE